MFSKACEYAMRAMIYIVRKTSDGSKAGIKEIALHTDSPEPFVAKVLQILCRQGLVSSTKGPRGGFYIEPKSRPVPLIEIVKAIDGDSLFFDCGLGIANCSDRKPCPIHHAYKHIRDQTINMLENNSIQDLATGLENGETFLVKS